MYKGKLANNFLILKKIVKFKHAWSIKIDFDMHYTMPISQRLKKLIKSLHQKQFRDQNGLFLAEGEKLAQELIKSDYHVELVVIRDTPSSDILDIVEHFNEKGAAIYTAPKHQFDQICDTKSPQNILAVINIQQDEPDTGKPFVALDGISDPGNVGTIIRTACWFGIEQVILGRDCADMYNPKVVRSSMGTIFHTRLIYNPDLADFIKETFPKHKLFGAALDGDKELGQIKPGKNFGVIFGSEAHGLSDGTSGIIDEKFTIKGAGRAESLNVGIAAGITLYHFNKQ
jgi:TrmH family RNA methyltransferase